jgi:ribosome-binding protein 1
MDLQVYAIILIVFLVSFLSYLFISKFLPGGKTFDEMIAEKKRMREEVLGLTKPVSKEKQSNSGSKKKPKKEVKKVRKKKEEVMLSMIHQRANHLQNTHQTKVAKEVTSNESDASESSEAVRSEPATPPETLVLRKNAAKPQQQQQQAKKSKGKGGILVNKNEPVLVKEAPIEEEVNHFEEIHPKDAVEMHVVEKKHFRDTKKSKPAKLETPPISPKNQPVKVEEKPAKKKRNEPSLSAVDSGAIQLVSDETGITPLIREISRADLTKNQIQVLIDFLLNKQSDTLAHEPTEWSEGKSDLMQKLKKQLQEKEAQLKNEQDALSGMQSKLKELRSEFNTEKVQFNANLKAHAEHLQSSKMEIKNLQAEIQFLNDKHNNEKQTMSTSFKQVQAQYLQMKESVKAQEALPNVQQLQSDNQALQQEIAEKSQQILKLQAFVEEQSKKDVSLLCITLNNVSLTTLVLDFRIKRSKSCQKMITKLPNMMFTCVKKTNAVR